MIIFGCVWFCIGRDWFGFFIVMILFFVWGGVNFWSVVFGDFLRGFVIVVWYVFGYVGFILWVVLVFEYFLFYIEFYKE